MTPCYISRAANGLTMTGGSRDALDVQFKASVAAIETAFNVNIGLYHDSVANRDFLCSGPRTQRRPAFPALMHITGLDNYSIPKSSISRTVRRA